MNTELDERIHQDLTVCHDILSNNTYKEFIDTILSAWYKRVPHSPSEQMLPSNCWYTKSFSKVSKKMARNLAVRDFFVIPVKFPQFRIGRELRTMLNTPVKFEVPTNNSKPLGEAFCLPAVYMPGFPKCGTTSLYDQLTSHPDFVEAIDKEGQFWGHFVTTKDPFYIDLQVLLYTYRFKGSAKKISQSIYRKVTMDASTKTVYDSANLGDAAKDMCLIPYLLHRVLPNTKIIILLRNPTRRLWSHYWFDCSNKVFDFSINHTNEHLPPVPKHMIENAPERFHNHTLTAIHEFNHCIQRGESEFKCTYDVFYHEDEKHQSCNKIWIGLSLYYFHIVKWLSVFPRDQFLFLTTEELEDNSYSVASSAWDFIGLDPLPKFEYRPVVLNSNNWITSSRYRDSFKMWPKTKELLDDFFRPYNERLARLLDDKRFLFEK